MDFEPGDEILELRDRVRAFMDEHIFPREAELHEALDREVGPGVPYPAELVEIRAQGP